MFCRPQRGQYSPITVGKSVFAVPMLRFLVVISLLICVWTHRSPAYLIARDVSGIETGQTDVTGQLHWNAAEQAVGKRYGDGTVAVHIKQMDYAGSQNLLQQTWQLIENNYYQSIETKELLDKSLLQLQVVTENAEIYQQYHSNKKSLAALNEQIRILRGNLNNNSNWDINDVMGMAESMRKSSIEGGLGQGWPGCELAYALSANLDNYTHMLSPGQYERLRDQLDGFYVGIGIELIFTDDYPLVFDVVPDSPAAKKGILPGDQIIKINDRNIKGKASHKVGKMLSGSDRSKIKITIKRGEMHDDSLRKESNYGNKHIEIYLQREIISAPTVRYARLIAKISDQRANISTKQTKTTVDNQDIGYLRIASFDYDTTWQMRREIDKLCAHGAKSLLIDLRNNGGGVISSAIDAVRLFIDEGIIVTIREANETLKYRAGGDNFSCYKMPVAILVNKHTASAAEMFAAALESNNRAVIIGEKTFGKAVIQTIYPIKNSSAAICITTATYIPPDDNDFNHIGLIPNIMVKTPQIIPEIPVWATKYISQDDPVIKKALDYLQQKLSS